jgi:hypothetical protein
MLAKATNAPLPEEGVKPSVRATVQRDAATVLREHGQPMTIADLHAEFIRRKYLLPGRGTATNLIPHLQASDEFVRPQRGTYGLAEWENETRPLSLQELPEERAGSGT